MTDEESSVILPAAEVPAHTNSYRVKPFDFEKFTSMMETVGFYWLMWNCRLEGDNPG